VTTEEVLGAVHAERIRQDERWGIQNHDVMKWLVILGEEFGEGCEAALDFKSGDVTLLHPCQELQHVAAVAVAMIESLERQAGGWEGKSSMQSQEEI